MIERRYITVGNGQRHVLVGGSGPSLVMLHALPLWSRSLEPLIEQVADHFTIIAPDLAGYGLSDPLPDERPTACAFADDVRGILERLNVDTFALYAVQDSTAIAALLAERTQARLRALILDEPFMLTSGERHALRSGGSSRFEPEATGSYLLKLWDAARQRHLFRQASPASLASRRDEDMPNPAQLTEIVKAYMRAGSNYVAAIEAGLEIDYHRALQELRIATLILADERVDGQRLPPESTVTRIARVPVGPLPRGSAIVRFLADCAVGQGPLPRVPSVQQPSSDEFKRLFIPVPGGHLHARASSRGSARPVLALHDPAGSHQLVLPFVEPMRGTRPIIALDLPGNGESDNTLAVSAATSGDYARAIIEGLDSLGLGDIDVIGRYSGGPIAMEMSFQRPGLIRHLVQAAVAIYRPNAVANLLQHYTPSIEPRRDGAHLALAWHMMTNQALYWPWFNQTRTGIIWGDPQLDPALIHQRVYDLLRVGDLYRQAYRAMWTYPMEERLPSVRIPMLLCAPRWDPLFGALAEVHSLVPSSLVSTLPDRFADWAEPFMAFFDT